MDTSTKNFYEKDTIMEPLTEAKKDAIKTEIKSQFDQLIAAINQKNSDAWS